MVLLRISKWLWWCKMVGSTAVVVLMWCVSLCVGTDGQQTTGTTTLEVDTPVGTVRGQRQNDQESGQSYVRFMGIPYAKPPVGQLRFAKPQPHPPFDEVFDATREDRIVCPYPQNLPSLESNFTEDCLVLNIKTKHKEQEDHFNDNDNASDLKKVLVYIHGGAFMTGSSYFYDFTSFVVSQDVIVVAVNYRFGALGFFSTDDEASPGNYGLWDQRLALQWVQQNIQAFGGDPNDVTVAGESAGAMSVGFHVISPHSKGLFSKGYLHSGGATSRLALAEHAQEDAVKLAKSVGCWDQQTYRRLELEESQEIIQCLRELPYASLTSITFNVDRVVFAPVVDGDFIPERPLTLLHNENYLESVGFFNRSYLFAFNNFESGSMSVALALLKNSIYLSKQLSDFQKDATWGRFLASIKQFYMKSRIDEEKWLSDKNISKAVDEFYGRRFAVVSEALVQIMTDLNFYVTALDHASAASRRKSSHAYVLNFDLFPEFMKGNNRGLPHAADIMYWMGVGFPEAFQYVPEADMQAVWTGEDREITALFSSLVGAFVRTGNPELALKDKLPSGWPEYNLRDCHFLNFNLDPWVSNFPHRDTQALWFKTVPVLMGEERLEPPPEEGGKDDRERLKVDGCVGNAGICWGQRSVLWLMTLWPFLELILR